MWGREGHLTHGMTTKSHMRRDAVGVGHRLTVFSTWPFPYVKWYFVIHMEFFHLQVIFVIMRHITDLRTIYNFYSKLGYEDSPDNTYVMSRMQFWRFLKDCQLHHQEISLMQMDRILGEKGLLSGLGKGNPILAWYREDHMGGYGTSILDGYRRFSCGGGVGDGVWDFYPGWVWGGPNGWVWGGHCVWLCESHPGWV